MSSGSTHKLLGGPGQKRSDVTRTDATIPHPQLAQNSAQSPGLQVTQRGSTFGKAITATGDASIKAGNYVDGVKSGEFDQEGSAYQDNIVSEDKAKVSLGNHMNGQQSG